MVGYTRDSRDGRLKVEWEPHEGYEAEGRQALIDTDGTGINKMEEAKGACPHLDNSVAEKVRERYDEITPDEKL